MSNLKTEHEIEIDKIHDRQLAEKDLVIETMNAAHKVLMAEKDTEIKRLQKLLLVTYSEIIYCQTLLAELSQAITSARPELEPKWKQP